MSVLVMAVLVIFIEAFLHYFPWRLVLGGRELPRVAAYTLGVMGLLGPYAAWLVGRGMVSEAVTLAVVTVAGGAAVAGCYALDWVIRLWWERREAQERERAAMRELRDGAGR